MLIDNLSNLQITNPIEYISLVDNKSNNYEYPIINFLMLSISTLKLNHF